MLHAIIMAGGTGTRFWPASRADAPKQLLPLVGDASMIRQTVDRLGNLVAPEQTLIVTNQRLTGQITGLLPELPSSSILGEPCKRDTAPCIGLAALIVNRGDADATLAVMPADHVIRPSNQFQAAVRHGARMVDESPGRIVTFGIRPSYAAEIFGYIQRGAPLETVATRSPDKAALPGGLTRAYRHTRWSSFVKSRMPSPPPSTWLPASTIGTRGFSFGRRAPYWKHWPGDNRKCLATCKPLSRPGTLTTGRRYSNREFAAIDGISIDYAVMEHATDVAVIEAPFDWDDLGGWQSLARLLGSDAQGNTLAGKQLAMNSSGTIVRSTDDHLVVALGMTDCIIVHTSDATLVANKHDEESIRAVVKELHARGWYEHL